MIRTNEELRRLHEIGDRLTIVELAQVVARHAMMHGGPIFSHELKCLVLKAMLDMHPNAAVVASRYGVCRNTIYRFARAATEGRKVKIR